LNDKRVPPQYLRAAPWQRLALLQGLIDTDGSVAPDGQVEFCSMRRGLALAVQELVFSLGRKASIHEGRAMLDGRDYGTKYRVMFYMADAASLPRKLDRCRDAEKKPHRYVRFRPAGKADTVCIQVSSPDGMFLAGRNFLPTHNSEIVSRILPSFLMGYKPDDPVMACSYGDSLASDMNIDVQRIVDSERYRDVFPGTRLPGDGRKKGQYVRTTDRLDIVGREGVYRCAGVGGPITGKPFLWGIIDDPYKNDEEANSPTMRQRLWDWYTTVFRTRKRETGARTLLTLTPWHSLDIRGQLLALAKSDPNAEQWMVLKFPAILESESQRQPYDFRSVGEALWEERHSKKTLLAAKASMAPAKWSAMYGCDPTPAGGVIYHPEDFRYFATEVRHGEMWFLLYDAPAGVQCEPRRVRAEDCVWFQTIDAADTKSETASFTCVGTFARTPEGDMIVWHVWRWKLEFPKRYKAIVALRQGVGRWDPAEECFGPYGFVRWPKPLAYQAIEMKSSGIAIAQQGASEGLPFRALKPGTKSKAERAAHASVLYSNHKVFHHRGAAWLTDLELELPNFPAGASDDQGDVISYGGIMVMTDVTIGAPSRGGESLILSGAGDGLRDLPTDRFGEAVTPDTTLEAMARLSLGLEEGQYLGPGDHVIDFGVDDDYSRPWYH
jgi:hypothetical protein